MITHPRLGISVVFCSLFDFEMCLEPMGEVKSDNLCVWFKNIQHVRRCHAICGVPTELTFAMWSAMRQSHWHVVAGRNLPA